MVWREGADRQRLPTTCGMVASVRVDWKILYRTVAAGLLPTLFFACDDAPSREPPDEPPRPPSLRDQARGDGGLAALLGLDAGDLPAPEPPADPAAPPGDLKEEVERFTTLEACVTARATFDPVVGDAIDALGYDRLKRDACRVLQAVKQKDVSACEQVLASSLRQHCVSTVAVAEGDPLLCPVVGENHDALCIALARRDDRLCSTTSLADRTVCRAVLARDPSLCRKDTRCKRRVERWKSFLPENIERPDLGTKAKVSVAEHIEGGTLPPETFDLGRELHGATVREHPNGRRIELGDASSRAWPPAGIVTRPRVSMRMLAIKEVMQQGRHQVPPGAIDFELLVPHRGLLATETIEGPMFIEVDLLGVELGSPVRFTIEADVGPSHRKFHVRFEINTFVRDVVKVGENSPAPAKVPDF